MKLEKIKIIIIAFKAFKIENINIHFRQTEQLGEKKKRKTGNGSGQK